MTSTLCIERPATGLRDRYRSYEVYVNGVKRAELARGEVARIEVEPGDVEVYITIDWCKSRAVGLAVDPGAEVRLRCRPRNLLSAIYGVTFGRNNYVRLEPA
jgi:hypothetical protein